VTDEHSKRSTRDLLGPFPDARILLE